MLFIHMISRVNARLFPQGSHQLWLNFQVEDINPRILINAYFLGRNFHEQGIPFLIVRMSEDGVVGEFFPRVIRLCLVLLLYVINQLLTVHVLLLSLESTEIERPSLSVNLNEVPSIIGLVLATTAGLNNSRFQRVGQPGSSEGVAARLNILRHGGESPRILWTPCKLIFSTLGDPTLAGRWSLLHNEPLNDTARALALVEGLVDRYGVVTRSAAVTENLPGGFPALRAVFRSMEDVGKVLRGRFIEGLGARHSSPNARP